ncbi:hypothetical protein D5S18_31315 [Nocardia panacis]|uniref:Uncharacterized protein n=1 Tax=Nocardia panacis TaxID=2340916 RepID=A0A3A4K877_9NOCA|nr:hypothetical protein D5S18_31315 [Nocardia panacis]
MTLTDREEEGITILANKNSPEWALLQLIAAELGYELTETSSEATILRVLMASGLQQIRGRLLEQGYERMARLYEEDAEFKSFAVEDEALLRDYAENVDRNLPA